MSDRGAAEAHAITAETCAKYAVNGSLSYCLEIGRRVAAIQAGEPGALAEFLSYCQASALTCLPWLVG